MSGDINAAAETIRRSIMASMAVTTAETGSGSYTHDDYDAAHAALDALVAEVERLREQLEARDRMLRGADIDHEQLRAERDAALNREQEVIDTANEEIRALRVEKQSLRDKIGQLEEEVSRLNVSEAARAARALEAEA